MLKILQAHLLRAFVANLKIDAIYAFYPERFCDKNLAIRKVFAFSDSGKRMAARAPGGTRNAMGRSKKKCFFRNDSKIGDFPHPQLPSVHLGIFYHFLPKKS